MEIVKNILYEMQQLVKMFVDGFAKLLRALFQIVSAFLLILALLVAIPLAPFINAVGRWEEEQWKKAKAKGETAA